MLGIAGAAGSVAPSLLKAEPAKPKEIIVKLGVVLGSKH